MDKTLTIRTALLGAIVAYLAFVLGKLPFIDPKTQAELVGSVGAIAGALYDLAAFRIKSWLKLQGDNFIKSTVAPTLIVLCFLLPIAARADSAAPAIPVYHFKQVEQVTPAWDYRIVYDLKGDGYQGTTFETATLHDFLGRKGFTVHVKSFFGTSLKPGAAKVVAGFLSIQKTIAAEVSLEIGIGARFKTGAPANPMFTIGFVYTPK